MDVFWHSLCRSTGLWWVQVLVGLEREITHLTDTDRRLPTANALRRDADEMRSYVSVGLG